MNFKIITSPSFLSEESDTLGKHSNSDKYVRKKCIDVKGPCLSETLLMCYCSEMNVWKHNCDWLVHRCKFWHHAQCLLSKGPVIIKSLLSRRGGGENGGLQCFLSRTWGVMKGQKEGWGGSSLIKVRNLAFARFWYDNNYT